MMPHFLTCEEVIELHLDQIFRYGGDPGIRDLGLLESAVAQPSASFGDTWLHSDIYEMAAAYLFHIVRNHPFVDGNKRTGTVAALVFLELNGLELVADWEELADTVIAVASGSLTKEVVASFFRSHCQASS